MLRVQNIMTKNVVSLSPETTIREAMETLATHHLSGAPVIAGSRVLGVVSMSDILSFIIDAPVADTADSAETVAEAWEESIVDDEDDADIESVMSGEAAEEWSQTSDGLADEVPDGGSLLDSHTVEEAMTEEVISVERCASVKKAASLMQKHGIHRVMVMDGNKLCGIVSTLDVARAFSQGMNGRSGVRLDPCAPDPSPWIDI